MYMVAYEVSLKIRSASLVYDERASSGVAS